MTIDDGHALGMDAARNSDSGLDATMIDSDARPTATEHWIASKTALDVWWQGTPTSDPGRDHLDVFTLTHAIEDGGERTVVVKLCGVVLPTFTSDVRCDAHEVSFPDQTWDRPEMPRFIAHPSTLLHDADAGDEMPLAITATLGVEDAIEMVATVRTDAAFYQSDYDEGACWNGRPYALRGVATAHDLGAGAGPGGYIRARYLNVNVRATLPVDVGSVDAHSVDHLAATAFELNAIDCQVDPATLDFWDDRAATMNYACTEPEAMFVAAALPQYRVLARGQRPGESMRPLGWNLIDRDIDTRTSEGTRVQQVVLDVDDIDAGGDGEPSCAQVRAALSGS